LEYFLYLILHLLTTECPQLVLEGGRVIPPPSRAAAGCIAPHSQDMVTVIPPIDCFEAKFCKTELS